MALNNFPICLSQDKHIGFYYLSRTIVILMQLKKNWTYSSIYGVKWNDVLYHMLQMLYVWRLLACNLISSFALTRALKQLCLGLKPAFHEWWLICSCINISITFDKYSKMAIGQKLISDFKIGKFLACFHIDGKVDVVTIILNKFVKYVRV